MNVTEPHRKVVLVTGCSSGIGKACCELLSARNKIYGLSRSPSFTQRWDYIQMDVTDESSVAIAIGSIFDREGRIDAVVHCAGVSLAGAVEDTTVAEAISQFQTNYFGTIRVLRAVLPIMRRQSGGRLIVMGSIGGLIGLPFQAHYSATKFALDGMVEAVRREVAPFNISVSILHPGNFKTALNENRSFADGSSAAYDTASKKAASFYAEEELNAESPALVARQIEKILELSRPQRSYLVGSVLERLGVVAKRILPTPVFDYFVGLFYFP